MWQERDRLTSLLAEVYGPHDQIWPFDHFFILFLIRLWFFLLFSSSLSLSLSLSYFLKIL